MVQGRLDLRTLVFILGAGLAGIAWAYFNLQQAGGARGPQVLRPLVWTVFATPFFTFWGWLAARPAERWRAFVTCLAIYFFAVFLAARIEHLVLGRDQANALGHSYYFNAVILIQALAVLTIAVQRAWDRGIRHRAGS